MTKRERDRERRRKKLAEEWKPIYDMFIALYPFTTESLDSEIWLPVPNFEGYQVSNFGRVKSFCKGKEIILKPRLTRDGYLRVILCKNGKQKTFRLNVLVGKLFIPNPDNKPQVNHRYSRFSNHIDCLEWATQSENQNHAYATGLQKSGEEHYKAKLTNEQVIYIRENPDGLNTYQLSEKFGVDNGNIGRIQRGETYKNIGGKIREKKYSRPHNRTPDDKRAQIIADYQPHVREHSYTAVAKRFNVSVATVWNIVNGK